MRATPLVALICIAAAACASAGSSTEAGVSTEHRLLDATFMSNAYESKTVVPASLDRVWRVLPAVYDTLGIPINRADGATHDMVNVGMRLHRELNHTALSRYIDCGETQIGPNADSYEVQMSIHTKLTAQGDSTLVTTAMDAQAQSQYAQGFTPCSSKGALEKRIADAVRARVGG